MPDSSTPFRVEPIPYEERLDRRTLESIDLVVIHCTELPDLATARRYGERIHYAGSQTGNCGHYIIDRDGFTEQWVSPKYIAHHVRGFNERSVGIELVNSGRYPDWLDSRRQVMTEAYRPMQIAALGRLLLKLEAMLPSARWIAGHDALDSGRIAASDDASREVRRKLDPGPMFPWSEVLATTGLEQYQRQAGS